MCGIAGRLSPQADAQSETVVQAMCDAMVHRGPNDQGVLTKGCMVLGHRRLSILDLSTRARQPMSTPDGRFHISYNGEIYNFQEIRKDLETRGVSFRTTCDTEVVLHAYAEYGAGCLNTFNGMFALAIWDDRERRLFLARDRFGKKPLFYCLKPGVSLTFASEMTALRKDPDVDGPESLEAINCYLALGYFLSPLTLYEGVCQLEAATWMEISADCRIVRKNRYWDYAELFRTKTSDAEPTVCENLRTLLEKAVQRRMISDVPVGAFLSGGVDSSSVVAMMKKSHRGELHTFSVGFALADYDESPAARRVSEHFGTIHHAHQCEPGGDLANVNASIAAYDQPFSDTSLVPTVDVCALASRHVTVVLAGDGADEIFAGYLTYRADRYYGLLSWIPCGLRQWLAEDGTTPSTKRKLGWRYKKRQFFYGALGDYRQAHATWRLLHRPEERIRILGEKHRALVLDTDPVRTMTKHYGHVSDLHPIDQHLYVDAMTWLTDDILVKVDRASMHSSIEVRSPYLDIEFVRYVASLPVGLKLKGLQGKWALKQALRGILPEYVLTKGKSGFNSPVGEWLGKQDVDEFRAFNRHVMSVRRGQHGAPACRLDGLNEHEANGTVQRTGGGIRS